MVVRATRFRSAFRAASWWQYLTFGWLNPLMRPTINGIPNMDWVPEIATTVDDTIQNATAFADALATATIGLAHMSTVEIEIIIIKVLLCVFKWKLLINIICKLTFHVILLMALYFTSQLVGIQSKMASAASRQAPINVWGSEVGLQWILIPNLVLGIAVLFVGTHAYFWEVRIQNQMFSVLQISMLMHGIFVFKPFVFNRGPIDRKRRLEQIRPTGANGAVDEENQTVSLQVDGPPPRGAPGRTSTAEPLLRNITDSTATDRFSQQNIIPHRTNEGCGGDNIIHKLVLGDESGWARAEALRLSTIKNWVDEDEVRHQRNAEANLLRNQPNARYSAPLHPQARSEPRNRVEGHSLDRLGISPLGDPNGDHQPRQRDMIDNFPRNSRVRGLTMQDFFGSGNNVGIVDNQHLTSKNQDISGQIWNVVEFDVDRCVSNIVSIIYIVSVFPLVFSSSLYMLCRSVPSLFNTMFPYFLMAGVLIFVLLSGIVVYFYSVLTDVFMFVCDFRTSLVNECSRQIRGLRMLAWERYYLREKILRSRLLELKVRKTRAFLNAAITLLGQILPRLLLLTAIYSLCRFYVPSPDGTGLVSGREGSSGTVRGTAANTGTTTAANPDTGATTAASVSGRGSEFDFYLPIHYDAETGEIYESKVPPGATDTSGDKATETSASEPTDTSNSKSKPAIVSSSRPSEPHLSNPSELKQRSSSSSPGLSRPSDALLGSQSANSDQGNPQKNLHLRTDVNDPTTASSAGIAIASSRAEDEEFGVASLVMLKGLILAIMMPISLILMQLRYMLTFQISYKRIVRFWNVKLYLADSVPEVPNEAHEYRVTGKFRHDIVGPCLDKNTASNNTAEISQEQLFDKNTADRKRAETTDGIGNTEMVDMKNGDNKESRAGQETSSARNFTAESTTKEDSSTSDEKRGKTSRPFRSTFVKAGNQTIEMQTFSKAKTEKAVEEDGAVPGKESFTDKMNIDPLRTNPNRANNTESMISGTTPKEGNDGGDGRNANGGDGTNRNVANGSNGSDGERQPGMVVAGKGEANDAEATGISNILLLFPQKCTYDWEPLARSSNGRSNASAYRSNHFTITFERGFRLNVFDVCILTGDIGVGKTMALHALLGELVLQSSNDSLPTQKLLREKRLQRFSSGEKLTGGSTNNSDLALASGGFEMVNYHICYAPQQAFLLDDTIRSNIVFGLKFHKQTYTTVLHLCCLADEVMHQFGSKKDLFFLISSGSNISGGQRQRVQLARCLYKILYLYWVQGVWFEHTNGIGDVPGTRGSGGVVASTTGLHHSLPNSSLPRPQQTAGTTDGGVEKGDDLDKEENDAENQRSDAETQKADRDAAKGFFNENRKTEQGKMDLNERAFECPFSARPFLMLLDDPLSSIDDNTSSKIINNLFAYLKTHNIPGTIILALNTQSVSDDGTEREDCNYKPKQENANPSINPEAGSSSTALLSDNRKEYLSDQKENLSDSDTSLAKPSHKSHKILMSFVNRVLTIEDGVVIDKSGKPGNDRGYQVGTVSAARSSLATAVARATADSSAAQQPFTGFFTGPVNTWHYPDRNICLDSSIDLLWPLPDDVSPTSTLRLDTDTNATSCRTTPATSPSKSPLANPKNSSKSTGGTILAATTGETADNDINQETLGKQKLDSTSGKIFVPEHSMSERTVIQRRNSLKLDVSQSSQNLMQQNIYASESGLRIDAPNSGVRFSTYVKYLKAGGPILCGILFVILILATILEEASMLLLSYWGSQDPKTHVLHPIFSWYGMHFGERLPNNMPSSAQDATLSATGGGTPHHNATAFRAQTMVASSRRILRSTGRLSSLLDDTDPQHIDDTIRSQVHHDRSDDVDSFWHVDEKNLEKLRQRELLVVDGKPQVVQQALNTFVADHTKRQQLMPSKQESVAPTHSTTPTQSTPHSTDKTQSTAQSMEGTAFQGTKTVGGIVSGGAASHGGGGSSSTVSSNAVDGASNTAPSTYPLQTGQVTAAVRSQGSSISEGASEKVSKTSSVQPAENTSGAQSMPTTAEKTIDGMATASAAVQVGYLQVARGNEVKRPESSSPPPIVIQHQSSAGTTALLAQTHTTQTTDGESVITEKTITVRPIETRYLTSTNLFRLFLVMTILQLLLRVCVHVIMVEVGLSAMRTISHRCFRSLFLRQTLRWWDTTPMGSIVNRLCNDIGHLDENPMETLVPVVTVIIVALVSLTVAAFCLSFVIVLLVPMVLIGIYLLFGQRAAKMKREVTRIRLKEAAIVFQYFTECIRGATVIRAFGYGKQLCCKALVARENLDRTTFLNSAVLYWLTFRLALFQFGLRLLVMLYPVLEIYHIVPIVNDGVFATATLALIGIGELLREFLLGYMMLEVQMISVNRISEWSDLEHDFQTKKDAIRTQSELEGRSEGGRTSHELGGHTPGQGSNPNGSGLAIGDEDPDSVGSESGKISISSYTRNLFTTLSSVNSIYVMDGSEVVDHSLLSYSKAYAAKIGLGPNGRFNPPAFVTNPNNIILAFHRVYAEYGQGPSGNTQQSPVTARDRMKSNVPSGTVGNNKASNRNSLPAAGANNRRTSAIRASLFLDEVIASKLSNRAVALQDISFAVRRGEKLLIVGRTGSGKSTLLLTLLQLLPVAKGYITYYDRQNREYLLNVAKPNIGTATKTDDADTETSDANPDTSATENSGFNNYPIAERDSKNTGVDHSKNTVANATQKEEVTEEEGTTSDSISTSTNYGISGPNSRQKQVDEHVLSAPLARTKSCSLFDGCGDSSQSESQSSTIGSQTHVGMDPVAEKLLSVQSKLLPGFLLRQLVVRVIPQIPVVLHGSVAYNLDIRGETPREHIRTVLAGFFVNVDDIFLDSEATELSYSQKQFLQAARVLCSSDRCDVLLLDEVTSSLPDTEAKELIEVILRNFRGKTILCVTHQQHLFGATVGKKESYFDRKLFISKGRIVQNT